MYIVNCRCKKQRLNIDNHMNNAEQKLVEKINTMDALVVVLGKVKDHANRAILLLEKDGSKCMEEFTQMLVAVDAAKRDARALFGSAFWRTATPLAASDLPLKIWDVYCTDGGWDENYYVKAPTETVAKLQVQMVSEYRVTTVVELTADAAEADDLEDYQDAAQKLMTLAPGIPYLYDSGT